MVLECLGVWLCIFDLVNAEAIHFTSTHSLGSLLVCMLRWDKRGMCIERTITLIYINIYKFIVY